MWGCVRAVPASSHIWTGLWTASTSRPIPEHRRDCSTSCLVREDVRERRREGGREREGGCEGRRERGREGGKRSVYPLNYILTDLLKKTFTCACLYTTSITCI